MSHVCLLKKEAKVSTASKFVSMGNSNSSDPPSDGSNECLLEKLEKDNIFVREDLQNINVIIRTLI